MLFNIYFKTCLFINRIRKLNFCVKFFNCDPRWDFENLKDSNRKPFLVSYKSISINFCETSQIWNMWMMMCCGLTDFRSRNIWGSFSSSIKTASLSEMRWRSVWLSPHSVFSEPQCSFQLWRMKRLFFFSTTTIIIIIILW